MFQIAQLYFFRGPFITAMGKTWCPAHFTCSQATCQRSLQEVGFVEEKGMNFTAQSFILELSQPFSLQATFTVKIAMANTWHRFVKSVARKSLG